MSYSNQRGSNYGDMQNIRGESGLPKINEKRFQDVIDYSQPRPQSGYQNRGGDYEDDYPGHRENGKPGGFGGFAPGQGNTATTSKATGQINFDVQDGQPIQLITANPRTGQFTLNEEAAAELIANYEGNISFVTVVGKYKTGKSFLLNKLLDLRGNGFDVNSNPDACTQGVWIWSKPVYSERDNLHIFFLDVEGSNNPEKSVTHDGKVFSLSMLMSSYFIYNGVGAINENAINDISLATQLSRNITVSAEESSEHTLSFYTPKFLWALRDFNQELKDSQGKPISATQYLESSLSDQNSYNKSSDTNKKIRQALLNYFKDRDCLIFAKPGNNDKKLDSVPDNQLNPDFLRQVNVLREKIQSKASAKQLKGVNLNMRMYFSMVGKYIEAFNQGTVPNISIAWDYLVENECKEAYEQSVDLFEIALKQFFFNEDQAKSIDDLYNILKNIRDSALEKYNKITAPIERNEIVQEFKNELKDYIDKKEQQVVGINEELNQGINEELLQALTQNIKKNIESGVYGPNNIQDYYEDFNQFLDTYEEKGQGFSKTTNFIKFLNTFQPEVISSLMLALNKSYQANQKNIDQDKTRYAENEKSLKKNLEVLRDKEKAASDEIARLKAEKAELQNKTQRLNEQMQKLKNEGLSELEGERNTLKQNANKLKEKETEYQNLSKQNQELLDQIKKRNNACCNMF